MSLKSTGRFVGAFVLLAFGGYGVGSALAGEFAGTALVMLNSALVAAIGVLVFRLLQGRHPAAAWIYLVARGMEAYLLAAGTFLPAGGQMAYQLAMLSLGLGSLPFCLALGRQRLVPRWLAGWGFVGYALLAGGAAADLMGSDVGLVLSIPGGLFEVAFGVLLVVRGFTSADQPPGTADRVRRSALAAGLGLLLMAVLAGLAQFGVLARLVTDDAAETSAKLSAHQPAFTLAVSGLLVVACLDVLVGWALRTFFDGTHRTVALLSAWCRTGYAAVFALAITHLIAAAGLVHDGSDSSTVYAEIMRFDEIWSLALIVFGVHLLLLGWLAWRSLVVPTWIAALVAVAGAGYLADSIGPLVSDAYTVKVAAVTFVGEVALLAWLLVYAARSRTHQTSRQNSETAAAAVA
jgi:Domain of unknown function (DUF4386)